MYLPSKHQSTGDLGGMRYPKRLLSKNFPLCTCNYPFYSVYNSLNHRVNLGHIFKHCHEMTLFLLWTGTYCISCVVQQTSGVKDLSSLVRYDDSSLAAIRHVQTIIPVVRPRPNIRSHSVLYIELCCEYHID